MFDGPYFVLVALYIVVGFFVWLSRYIKNVIIVLANVRFALKNICIVCKIIGMDSTVNAGRRSGGSQFSVSCWGIVRRADGGLKAQLEN